MNFPKNITVGPHTGGHIQGIAADLENGFLYCSFTTELVKYDFDGRFIGSAKGLTGHLGCIAFGPDGRVWGSLEYKNDAIGKGIAGKTGVTHAQAGFYAAIFDGAKITRPDMDASADGIMTAVHLAEVTDDHLYTAEQNGGGTLCHRFGCSGIDGMTFAPLPGTVPDENGNRKMYLHVAYGVYGDTTRADNDYQVILAYDVTDWAKYEQPLTAELHRSGSDRADGKFFVRTGNTTWGVQNLEYEPQTGRMYMAVYTGKKPIFPNYPMYIADWNAAPRNEYLAGFGDGTKGDTVPLFRAGLYHAQSDIFGWTFPLGSTGMIALGDGKWAFSRNYSNEQGQWSEIRLYRRTGNAPDCFVLAEE